MAVPHSELQSLTPTSIIELFQLELNSLQHGINYIYYFHAGTSLKSNGSVYWANNEYTPMPIQADGFEYSGTGQLPRPKIRIANLNGMVSSILSALPNGLEGAKITRIRTFARYIDNNNFPGDTNPYGAPDSSMKMPDEVFYVDRMISETRDLIEFELVAVFDLMGVRSPKRQCLPNMCQWVYKSAECSYSPAASITGIYNMRFVNNRYTMSGSNITITSAGHGYVSGDKAWFSFPVASGVYTWSGGTITITSSGHGFADNDRAYFDFLSGTNIDNYYVISGVTANTFQISPGSTASGLSGIVDIKGDAATGFYSVASASGNTFTISGATVGSGITNGAVNAYLAKIVASGHGLSVGKIVHLDFNGGGIEDGGYTVNAAFGDTFCVATKSGTTASGTVFVSQFYDENDNPVAASGSDVCGKRLSSCQARFGKNNTLPFGGFPGIGAYKA